MKAPGSAAGTAHHFQATGGERETCDSGPRCRHLVTAHVITRSDLSRCAGLAETGRDGDTDDHRIFYEFGGNGDFLTQLFALLDQLIDLRKPSALRRWASA